MKEKFGTREKLIDAILEIEKRSKDTGFARSSWRGRSRASSTRTSRRPSVSAASRGAAAETAAKAAAAKAAPPKAKRQAGEEDEQEGRTPSRDDGARGPLLRLRTQPD